MAEDEESINPNMNNTIMMVETVTGLTATSLVLVEINTALPMPEVGSPVEESQVTGVGDADVDDMGPLMGESSVEEVMEMEKDEVAEAVNTTKGETDSFAGDEKVVMDSKENQNDQIVVTKENVAVLEKDEAIEEAVNAKKGEVDSCMPGGAGDEKVVMTINENDEIVVRKDNIKENVNVLEKDEVAEVNATKGEADSCADDEKVVMTSNENENDQIVSINDNKEEAEKGETVVTEANVSTVEGSSSVGLGKDGENPVEVVKREKVGIPLVVLEKEDEAMGTDDVADNADGDDEMVSQVDNLAIEARVESEKDVEMDTMKDEKVEPIPQDEMEDKGTGVEDEADNGEKVVMARNEEDDEMATGVDSSAIEAKIELEKEVEPVPLNEEDEGTGANATTTEMDTMKDEEVESVPLDEEEDEGTGAEDEAANAATAEIETETERTESGKSSGGKRKRKNIKNTGKSKSGGRASSRKTIGEDVCFICFDGGNLVLCDRRGYTKAYHPSCIDRDEEFFRAKGRWNCGCMPAICATHVHFHYARGASKMMSSYV